MSIMAGYLIFIHKFHVNFFLHFDSSLPGGCDMIEFSRKLQAPAERRMSNVRDTKTELSPSKGGENELKY
jgi:hypothetical protein